MCYDPEIIISASESADSSLEGDIRVLPDPSSTPAKKNAALAEHVDHFDIFLYERDKATVNENVLLLKYMTLTAPFTGRLVSANSFFKNVSLQERNAAVKSVQHEGYLQTRRAQNRLKQFAREQQWSFMKTILSRALTRLIKTELNYQRDMPIEVVEQQIAPETYDPINKEYQEYLLTLVRNHLNEEEYDIWSLHVIVEYTLRQIAESLNVSEDVVQATLNRSQKRISKYLRARYKPC